MPATENDLTNQYAPTTWGGAVIYDYFCPSGQKCQLRKIGMTDLVQAGLLDEMDTLGVLMQEEVVAPAKGKKKPADRQPKKLTKAELAAKESAEEMAMLATMKDNPEQFVSMVQLLERMIPIVVVQPAILPSWRRNDSTGKWEKIEFSDRDPAAIYPEQIDMQDQMAIFGEAMGDKKMEELSSFRDQSNAAVDDVEDVASV